MLTYEQTRRALDELAQALLGEGDRAMAAALEILAERPEVHMRLTNRLNDPMGRERT